MYNETYLIKEKLRGQLLYELKSVRSSISLLMALRCFQDVE